MGVVSSNVKHGTFGHPKMFFQLIVVIFIQKKI
jgi:hypothetical protein